MQRSTDAVIKINLIEQSFEDISLQKDKDIHYEDVQVHRPGFNPG